MGQAEVTLDIKQFLWRIGDGLKEEGWVESDGYQQFGSRLANDKRKNKARTTEILKRTFIAEGVWVQEAKIKVRSFTAYTSMTSTERWRSISIAILMSEVFFWQFTRDTLEE